MNLSIDCSSVCSRATQRVRSAWRRSWNSWIFWHKRSFSNFRFFCISSNLHRRRELCSVCRERRRRTTVCSCVEMFHRIDLGTRSTFDSRSLSALHSFARSPLFLDWSRRSLLVDALPNTWHTLVENNVHTTWSKVEHCRSHIVCSARFRSFECVTIASERHSAITDQHWQSCVSPDLRRTEKRSEMKKKHRRRIRNSSDRTSASCRASCCECSRCRMYVHTEEFEDLWKYDCTPYMKWFDECSRRNKWRWSSFELNSTRKARRTNENELKERP